jgi:hypothetical protein
VYQGALTWAVHVMLQRREKDNGFYGHGRTSEAYALVFSLPVLR